MERQMGQIMRKFVLICTVWSAPLLFAAIYTCSIQRFKILVSFCSWAGWFESYLVENPNDTFSRDVAQIV